MDPSTKPILEIADLRVRRNADFELEINDFFLLQRDFISIVGPNGSGKTTFLETIFGALDINEGQIVVCDRDMSEFSEYKKNIGYIPDEDSWIEPNLSAAKYFNLLIKQYKKAGINRNMSLAVNQLSKYLFFKDFDMELRNLSHGNRKKVQIISAFLHSPPIVIVDELRNGLDPFVFKRAESLLIKANQIGVSIIAATHDILWAQQIADHVAMLQNGKIVLNDKVENLLNQSLNLNDSFAKAYQHSK